MNRRSFLQSLAACCAIGASRFAKSQPFYTPAGDAAGRWRFSPSPALPNVLLLGDSISIGYALDVRKLLTAKANVFRPMAPDGVHPENCGNTQFGLEHLASWLGNTEWRIIHFNFGLHDLCYRSPTSTAYGHRDKIHGVQDVPLPQYRSNLEEIVQRLERTHAQIVWASTTVVPPGEAGRFAGDEIKYNHAAAEIMSRRAIPIDHLYALTKALPPRMSARPGDVHFTAEGYLGIAHRVADCLDKFLGSRGG